MLDHHLLINYRAKVQEYKAETFLFSQDDHAENYYQICTGIVKLISIDSLGALQIHDLLYNGDEIASFAVYNDIVYPVSAVAETSCSVYILSKSQFFGIIKDHPSTAQRLLTTLSHKANYQFQLAKILYQSNANTKIEKFLQLLKNSEGKITPFSYEVRLSRKQLGMFMGLRVETVIRHIKSMERNGTVKIIGGKIFY